MKTKFYLKDWNPESHMTEPTGEVVSIYAIARSITPLNFAKLLDNYLNLGGKGSVRESWLACISGTPIGPCSVWLSALPRVDSRAL
jgi:hypothetical protein